MREEIVPEVTWPLPLSHRQLSLDLVEITIWEILVTGDLARCWSVLRSLQQLEVPVTGGGRTQLFNKPSRRRSLSPLIAKVRKAPKLVNGVPVTPVFSGRLVAREGLALTHGHAAMRKCVKISLELKLNIPRYLAAQDYASAVRRSRGSAPDFRFARQIMPNALASPREVKTMGDETSFGDDGNVLMGGDLMFRYAASRPPVAHCIALIKLIKDTITTWLQERLEDGDNELVDEPTYSLAQTEWHAEFGRNDPRKLVTQLTPMLLRQGRSGNIFRRRLTGQVKTFGPHSHGVQIALAVGIKQVTYAKTSRRVLPP